MREILFRGKRIDNGEWMYGDLIHDSYYYTAKKTIEIWNDEESRQCPVDAETVGQFTGLTDKNGKRIFEGDILSLRTGRPHIVKFEEGGFALTGTAIPFCLADKFEIIGNIHDNPELIV